jgi:hypothetical protein
MACDGSLPQEYKDAITDSNFVKLMDDDSAVAALMTREIAGQFTIGELRGQVARVINAEGVDASDKYQKCFLKVVGDSIQSNLCRAMPEGTCATTDACLALPGFDKDTKDCSLVKEHTAIDEELFNSCNQAFDKATKGITTTKEAKDTIASSESVDTFKELNIEPTCSACIAENNDLGSEGVSDNCVSKKYNTYTDSGPNGGLIAGLIVLAVVIVIAGGGMVYYLKKKKGRAGVPGSVVTNSSPLDAIDGV